jgi:bacterial/archaeal transporter family-2 protein
MQTSYLLMILGAGALLAFQAPVNARLREYAGSPILSSLISFGSGAALLFVMAVASNGFAAAGKLRTAPWWVFLGGSLGVAYVYSAMIAVPRIGGALLVIATVTGQMLMALWIDHNGWLGLEPTPATPKRLLGAGLLAVALWCLRK